MFSPVSYKQRTQANKKVSIIIMIKNTIIFLKMQNLKKKWHYWNLKLKVPFFLTKLSWAACCLDLQICTQERTIIKEIQYVQIKNQKQEIK